MLFPLIHSARRAFDALDPTAPITIWNLLAALVLAALFLLVVVGAAIWLDATLLDALRSAGGAW